MGNDKVRVALEKLDGISAAYVNSGVTLHMASKNTFDLEKVTEALKPFKLTIKESALDLKPPFGESAIKS